MQSELSLDSVESSLESLLQMVSSMDYSDDFANIEYAINENAPADYTDILTELKTSVDTLNQTLQDWNSNSIFYEWNYKDYISLFVVAIFVGFSFVTLPRLCALVIKALYKLVNNLIWR